MASNNDAHRRHFFVREPSKCYAMAKWCVHFSPIAIISLGRRTINVGLACVVYFKPQINSSQRPDKPQIIRSRTRTNPMGELGERASAVAWPSCYIVAIRARCLMFYRRHFRSRSTRRKAQLISRSWPPTRNLRRQDPTPTLSLRASLIHPFIHSLYSSSPFAFRVCARVFVNYHDFRIRVAKIVRIIASIVGELANKAAACFGLVLPICNLQVTCLTRYSLAERLLLRNNEDNSKTHNHTSARENNALFNATCNDAQQQY